MKAILEMQTFLLLVVLVFAGNWSHGRGEHPLHAVKTIKTAAGDIFDCVDIYKQPAFDHPLLKDHVIQMKPNIKFDSQGRVPQANGILNMELEGGGCPQGTVPVHRLPRANNKTWPAAPSDFSNASLHSSQNDLAALFAIRSGILRNYYGASSKINVYGVQPLTQGQVSAAMIWLTNMDAPPGSQARIQAGWGASYDIYQDYQTRFSIQYRKDRTMDGCLNLRCPGFVQVNPKIGLGGVIRPLSTIGGTQYYIYLHIYMDGNKNWWLAYGDVTNTLGYWPATLFNNFDHANLVDFGGFVECEKGKVCPPMGSGSPYIESEGCTMEEVQVVGPDHNWGGLGREKSTEYETDFGCYAIGAYVPDVHAYKFHFGGPPCDTAKIQLARE